MRAGDALARAYIATTEDQTHVGTITGPSRRLSFLIVNDTLIDSASHDAVKSIHFLHQMALTDASDTDYVQPLRYEIRSRLSSRCCCSRSLSAYMPFTNGHNSGTELSGTASLKTTMEED